MTKISAIKNCEIAGCKKISDIFFVKFRAFKGEFLRNHLVYWAQIFRDNWNCSALSTFRHFTLLGPSHNDKHMLTRQTKIRLLTGSTFSTLCSSRKISIPPPTEGNGTIMREGGESKKKEISERWEVGGGGGGGSQGLFSWWFWYCIYSIKCQIWFQLTCNLADCSEFFETAMKTRQTQWKFYRMKFAVDFVT